MYTFWSRHLPKMRFRRSCKISDRYIELNPVRAGLTRDPGNYPWSSYRANAEGASDQLLSAHPEYLALGQHDRSQRRAYRRLFQDGIESSLLERIRDATNSGYPLSSESFKSAMKLSRGWRIAPGRPGRPVNKEKGDDDLSLEIGL